MSNLPRHHITSRRAARSLLVSVIAVIWLITVVAFIGTSADCPATTNPASSISQTLSGAVQRADEQPGTGYVRDPRN